MYSSMDAIKGTVMKWRLKNSVEALRGFLISVWVVWMLAWHICCLENHYSAALGVDLGRVAISFG